MSQSILISKIDWLSVFKPYFLTVDKASDARQPRKRAGGVLLAVRSI